MKDIHDVLELTVYDEDKDHKYEFLGRVKIPLLRIRNDERRWYKLKDKKLRGPAKGDNPQILVECFIVYNKVCSNQGHLTTIGTVVYTDRDSRIRVNA